MKEQIVYGTLVATIAFVYYFGRCPKRTPDGPGLLSPSDGIIIGMEDNTILTQLSIFDVHCQRSPCSGTIVESTDINTITIQDDNDQISIVTLRQGAIGRSFRIDVKVKPGQIIKQGQIISQIWLGSNVRFTIPDNYKFTKHLGDVVYGGQTVIAIPMR